jgi:hypothetical protein
VRYEWRLESGGIQRVRVSTGCSLRGSNQFYSALRISEPCKVDPTAERKAYFMMGCGGLYPGYGLHIFRLNIMEIINYNM